MTNHTHDAVARSLRLTAADIDTHGANAVRCMADWALSGGCSGGGGPGPINAVSDPTGNAAIGRDDDLSGLKARWRQAVTDMSVNAWALCGCDTLGKPAHVRAAMACREIAYHLDRHKVTQTVLGEIMKANNELHHVIYVTVPVSRHEAEEELLEAKYLARRSDCCEVCESPIGPALQPGIPDTKRVSGLCKPGCYETEKKQVQRGQYVDRATFTTNMRAGIARGEIYRPSSPYWCTVKPEPRHEDDVA